MGDEPFSLSSDLLPPFPDYGGRLGRVHSNNWYKQQQQQYQQQQQQQQKSGSNFQCPSEGFHADPNDCQVFYRCVPNSRGYTTYRVSL